jgi:hypothetical protein
MLELGVLIIGIIIILIVLLYKDNYIKWGKPKEGFETAITSSTSMDNYYLSSCPTGYNTYYDSNGNINCCNGDVVANKCIGDKQCSLTSSNNPDSCVKIILDEYTEKSKTYCPSNSMPNYFEKGNIKGCTNGLLNSRLDGPANAKQASCVIYPDYKDNLTSVDSCLNHRKLDNAQCFGNNCNKSLIQPGIGLPILVGITFTDNNGLPHMAFTRESYEDALNVVNPNWKEKGIDLSKNVMVAEVAKAYYVDRTIQQSDIQI